MGGARLPLTSRGTLDKRVAALASTQSLRRGAAAILDSLNCQP
jgi:hypothetical protein